MPFINHGAREINCSVGYFGADLAERLASLQGVYDHLRREERGRIMAIPNASGALRQFDFLARDIGTLRGLSFRAHLYCADYAGIDVAEHTLLKRIDGIIFVAARDPQRMAGSVAALATLKSTLTQLRRSQPAPVQALQYHGDGDTALSAAAMDLQLNTEGHPAFAISDGQGAELVAVLDNVLKRIRKQLMP